MEKGKVIYSSGGNYKVLIDSKIFFAKPLGIFRKENIKILVGDIVDIEINEFKPGVEEINVITHLYERKNKFERPNISNIDKVILVTSVIEPKLNDFYLEKLITIFQSKDVEPIIVFTKIDLLNDKKINGIINEYISMGYKVIKTGNFVSKEDKKFLEEETKGKLTVITGQTGVGKSTFLNNINDSFKLKTGEISKALGRGKHTTRHSEAFEIFDNCYIVDTPGFSSLDLGEITRDMVFRNYLNFQEYANNCEFRNCSHTIEINCGIKNQNYSKRIINNYIKLIEEMK